MRVARSEAPLTAGHALFQFLAAAASGHGDVIRPDENTVGRLDEEALFAGVEQHGPSVLLALIAGRYTPPPHDVDAARIAALLADSSVHTE